MKYFETVDANIWDSENEAQVDKIVDWLTINVPGQFDFVDGELYVVENYGTTYSSPELVNDGEALIIDKNGLQKMSGRAFKAIYNLLTEEN
jgi:hypothetical protein